MKNANKFSSILVIMMMVLSFVPAAFADSLGPNDASTASEGPSSPAWSFPSNAIGSDDVYTTTPLFVGNTSNYLYLTGFDFAIPSDVTIDGIVVSIERSRDGGDPPVVHDATVRLMKGGAMTGDNNATSTSWPQAATVGDLVEDHGAVDYLWGTTWTPAEINAAGFGVAISAFREAGGTTGTRLARIDDVKIVVSFTDAAAPSASFIAAPTTVIEGFDSVTFDASASTDNVAIDSYIWDFGDSTTGTGIAPTHIYADDDGDDEYTVTLTINDTSGNLDSTTFDVAVTNVAPEFDLDVSPDPANTTLDLTCSLSDFVDPGAANDDSTPAYQWSVFDGVIESDIEGETSDMLSADETSKGNTYICEATVDDGDDGVTSHTASVSISNSAVGDVTITSPETDELITGDEQIVSWTVLDADDDDLTFDVQILTPDEDPETLCSDEDVIEDGDYSCTYDSSAYDDGDHTIVVTASDGESSSPASVDVVFDNHPPVFEEGFEDLSVETDEEEGTYLDFDLPTATDAVDTALDIECSIGEGESSTEIDGVEDFFEYGTTTVDCTATDDAENSEDFSFDVTVGHTPVVEILSPTSEDDWSGTHDVVFTATDADEEDTLNITVTHGESESDVICDMDEETIAPEPSYDSESGEYSCELVTTLISDGTDAYIEVIAEDGRDVDVSEFEADVVFTVDNTQPESWFTEWDDPAIGEVTFYGSSSDETSDVTGVEVQVDDGEWMPATCDFEVEVEGPTGCDSWYFDWTAPAEDGVEHTFRSRATDSADVPNVEDDFWDDAEARYFSEEDSGIEYVNELSVAAETLPTVTSVVTADTDGNQRIDRLVITFDEAINDSKLDAGYADGWDVYDTDGENLTADYLAESVGTGDVIDDNVIVVNVAEIGTDDGDVTPWISYTQEDAEGCESCESSTHDLSGNLELADGEWEATDGFSPAPSGGSSRTGGGGGGGGGGGSTTQIRTTTTTSTDQSELTGADEEASPPVGDGASEVDGGSGDITQETGDGDAGNQITGAVVGGGGLGNWWWLIALLIAIGSALGFTWYRRNQA